MGESAIDTIVPARKEPVEQVMEAGSFSYGDIMDTGTKPRSVETQTQTSWQDLNKSYEKFHETNDNDLKSYGGASGARRTAMDGFDKIAESLSKFKDTAENDQVKTILNKMDKSELLASVVYAKNGQDLQEALAGLLTPEERASLDQLRQLHVKADAAVYKRLEQAKAASDYGFANNDDQAKQVARKTMESILWKDSELFFSSPEIRGAYLQTQRNEQISWENGKASAIAYVDAAANSASYRAYISMNFPFLFSETKKQAEETDINRLAMARLINSDTAAGELEKFATPRKETYKTTLGDTAGLLTTALSIWGVGKTLELAAGKIPMPPLAKLTVSAGSGLLVGGYVNHELSGKDVQTAMLRNAGLSAITFASIKNMEKISSAAFNTPRDFIFKQSAYTLTGAGFGAGYEGLNYLTGEKQWNAESASDIGKSAAFFAATTNIMPGIGYLMKPLYPTTINTVLTKLGAPGADQMLKKGSQLFALPVWHAVQSGKEATLIRSDWEKAGELAEKSREEARLKLEEEKKGKKNQ